MRAGISEVCFKTRRLYQEIQFTLCRHNICRNKTKNIFYWINTNHSIACMGEADTHYHNAKEHKTTDPAIAES